MSWPTATLDARTGMPLPLPLAQLPLGEGLCFGDWSLWRDPQFEEDIYLYLIHARSRCVVHFPTSSNGWVNYQLKGQKDWYVIWSDQEVERQERSLRPGRYRRRRAARELPEGAYRDGEWTIWADGDVLAVRYSNERSLTFRRDSPKWTCDTAVLPGV
jgi:hypothetical protein